MFRKGLCISLGLLKKQKEGGNFMFRKGLCISLGLLLFLALCSMVVFAGGFPSKPITLIVNYGAGGATDVSARLLAQKAEKILGQPITIVNKAGAAGTIGLTELANSRKDGYTIGTTPFGALVIKPQTQKVPFNPKDDFEFILSYGQYMYGIVARSDSKFKSIDDLIVYAKDHPGEVTYGTAGFPHPLAIVGLEKLTGAKFVNVPYKSGAESASAVVGGHVNLGVQNINDVISFLKSGELRLLASVSPTRWDIWPKVPTLIEQGYDVSISSYLALGVPTGVPADTIEVLSNAFKEAFIEPDFQEKMINLGLQPSYLTGEEYHSIVKEQFDIIGEALEELGLK